MKRLVLALVLCLWSAAAWAQNIQCPDRPANDSSNACANTRFVQNGIISAPISTLLDQLGNTPGSMLFRGSTSWTVLAPTITSGLCLTFNTVINQPAWGSCSGSAGTVVGPGSSVTNDLAIFGSSSGTLLADSGVPYYSAGGALQLAHYPNVSASIAATTATCSATSPNITLTSALDFANNQGILLDHCGAASGLNVVGGITAVQNGTTGATTYHYACAAIDAAGGYGQAVSATVTNGNAAVSQTNPILVTCTPPSGGATPVGYAFWTDRGGSMQVIAITNGHVWQDWGYGIPGTPHWLPTTPPSSAGADWLITKINSGAGTTTLVLNANAGTTQSTPINTLHDDTVAAQAWATALNGGAGFICGSFNLSGQINFTSGSPAIQGCGSGSANFYLQTPNQVGFNVEAATNKVQFSGFSIYAEGGTGLFALGGSILIYDGCPFFGVYRDIQLIGAYVGISNNETGGSFLYDHLYIQASVYGAYQNGVIGDGWYQNVFMAPLNVPNDTNAIGWQLIGDPGGTHFDNVKCNGPVASYQICIATNINIATGDGDVWITNSSLESWTAQGVVFSRTAGIFGSLFIINDEINGEGTQAVEIADEGTGWISQVVIANSYLNATAPGGQALFLGGTTNVIVSNDTIGGVNIGIDIGPNVAGCIMGPFVFQGVTTQITGSTSNCQYIAPQVSVPTYPFH